MFKCLIFGTLLSKRFHLNWQHLTLHLVLSWRYFKNFEVFQKTWKKKNLEHNVGPLTIFTKHG